jgi:hypothetical protein
VDSAAGSTCGCWMRWPHWLQNRAVSGFSCPHSVQNGMFAASLAHLAGLTSTPVPTLTAQIEVVRLPAT